VQIAHDKHDATMGRLAGSGSRIQVSERAPVGFAAEFVGSSELATYRASGFNGASKTFSTELSLIKSVDTDGLALSGAQQVRDAATASVLTPILNSLAREQVSTNSTFYVEFPELAPEAGAVAEGAAASESTYDYIVREAQLSKWAHTMPVTEEALADNARLQSILSGALLDGVRRKAETAAGAAIVAAASGFIDAKHATGLVQAIRVGVAKVQTAGWIPTTCYLNPDDYAAIDIELMAATLSGAQRGTAPWQLSYVPTPAVSAGTAYVADSKSAFLYLDRGQMGVTITDSHASEFVSGIYRLKAEARGLVVVQRAGAVAKCAKGTPTA
jgi:hypothetical protein